MLKIETKEPQTSLRTIKRVPIQNADRDAPKSGDIFKGRQGAHRFMFVKDLAILRGCASGYSRPSRAHFH